MSLINKVKNIFSGSESLQEESNTEGVSPQASQKAASEASETVESSGNPGENFPKLPKERRVIQAPVLAASNPASQSDEILIKAQPLALGDQCVFMVNRTLMKGYSWFFSNFESAAESPLAEALFSLEDIETVLLLESTLTITRKDKTVADWRPLAKEVGKVVREILQQPGPWIAEKIMAELPSEESIREGIQKTIDAEVNPGVAGHGGHITLMGVQGNTVTIQMGGGCQGCSAADLTLKQGIHTSFRNAVPKVGAILDETDHSAGVNPYFS